MECVLHYGDETLRYTVARNPNLSTKVRIHVHPNGLIEAEAPSDAPPAEIKIALRKRARWITAQLREVAEARAHALPREFVSGETHFYLGKRYPLKIIQSAVEPSSVLLKGGQIRVTLPYRDPAAIKRRLNQWYRTKAADYFAKRLGEIASSVAWVRDEPDLKLLPMRKQWGSCSPSGAIHLNPWLVRAPRECIDYVIVHELCHLKEHNHSKRFYSLLDRQLPGWRHTKTRLDGMAELLLSE
ncbi:hypothetical protein PB2503_05812 [Parvularcula bermudensis HTCC2503]|uniref:YgjP-like metallopeptidase domain-containing protein n=1 Tax=Parvularcula bermudensis (strain ATCC BAA-594 / HTCC2503 / KCTC 12087) TaxID=314260 RepID=E0TGZ3_PARBH|nr:SprT family zinc-dependent metalloprotease [Parvularcula bermudensis]ADM09233.1 hypothetical protein PB2503_05812 [Parvularcula bermudensis HTCC2503]